MIYLDNSATTKPKKEVLDAYMKVNELFYANPSSLHVLGNQAEDLLETARTQLKNLLHMENVVFTSGGTEANNLALIGTAQSYQHRGKHIITAETEHPSVLNSLVALERQGFNITRLPVDSSGGIHVDELKKSLQNDTILVSLMHVNNEIGTIHPIADIARLLRKRRIFFHVDAVQSIGKLIFDPTALPDLITLSAHKIHGLKGSGLLAYSGVELETIQYGGGQESGIRSGTVSVPNAVALAKALRLVEPNPLHKQWNQDLRQFFSGFNGVKIVSPKQAAPHILAVAVKGIKGEILVSGLQKESVIVSTSSACSSKTRHTSRVIQAIGLPREFKDGVIRISFGEFTTEQDIIALKTAFQRVYRMIKGV
ncbi:MULTISPECIES: cysteine desulfurase family protein [Planococcus]|uniref:Aminotransferase class V n=2 Tax=Planococcus TaxID=1372 RepID=A0ABN4K015_9BACL|nr:MULTISPECIES: cysteine desulfurase family protein [Planococcus]ALS79096.1 aminotransferase class V [Planococcus kocurii]AQU78946.1 aminotransferase class V [Planococcus faecalis]MDJ0330884.1 cysteine desulfurase family protein [Planococcus sp. S3-L1]